MASEAAGRLVWEVWRLTHECAGSFPAPFEALSAEFRVWWCDTAVPLIADNAGSNELSNCGILSHRAVMDAGLPIGTPFTVDDVQPFDLLPKVKRLAWNSMALVAGEMQTFTPHAAGAFAS